MYERTDWTTAYRARRAVQAVDAKPTFVEHPTYKHPPKRKERYVVNEEATLRELFGHLKVMPFYEPDLVITGTIEKPTRVCVPDGYGIEDSRGHEIRQWMLNPGHSLGPLPIACVRKEWLPHGKV